MGDRPGIAGEHAGGERLAGSGGLLLCRSLRQQLPGDHQVLGSLVPSPMVRSLNVAEELLGRIVLHEP